MSSVVLLADINTRASVACLRSLRARGIAVWCATSGSRAGFVRHTSYRRGSELATRYQSGGQSEFCESLASIARQIGSYVLFPTGERVLRWAVESRDALAEQGVSLPTVGLKAYELVSDKQSFVALSARHGMAIPEEYTALPERFDRRLVVKPIRGCWDRSDVLTSPCLVESEESLRLLLEKNLDPREHFIQEYVEGASYYYCGLYDDGARRLSFVQKTLAQQPDGRSVVRAIPSRLPTEVVEKIDGMMKTLHWRGLMMIEVKESAGQYYAIECNPRIWGPLQLAVDNGCDFPYALWRLASGEPPEREPAETGRVGYFWMAGYVQGWVLGRRTQTSFQKHEGSSGIEFRDVWLRTDSYRYFALELARAFVAIVRSIVRRSRKGATA